jgi:hypothetical protein
VSDLEVHIVNRDGTEPHETRYQLRLLRGLGTIKTDLFTDYTQALTASREWRAAFMALNRCSP